VWCAQRSGRGVRWESDDPCVVFEDRLVFTIDLTHETLRFVRRVEVINGIVGRRRQSADDKARTVEGTLVRGL
jgi:hypothetical protein